jgi:hypothetical protein
VQGKRVPGRSLATDEEESMGSSQTTTDHDEIRRWAEQHGGVPAAVSATGSGDDPGILRIMFPEGPGDDEALEEISWDEWFDAFEENGLALVLDTDSESRFSKLVSRDNVEA